ncbi:MAG: DUF362 domain-containing protein [Thermoplasmata archaeon]|nr:DUF362 domain-containing protein [Thermoplasmata archaeon]
MAPEKRVSDVAIVRAGYDDIDIDGLLRPIGGMARYVASGARVLLKVNLLSAAEPRSAVTTHPAVVAAVARAVMDAGGKPFIADSPAGRFSKAALRKAYEKSGYARVAEDLGIGLNLDTDSHVRRVPIPSRVRSVRVCDFVTGADAIIALPKLKTHSYQVMTLATKVMYGIVPGLEKARLHAVYPRRAAFADMLLDVLSVAPPGLFVLDGILAMQGEGPGSGTPVETGVLMASTDAVAMDAAVCEMLGIGPMGVPTLRRAKVRGMWPGEVRYPLMSPGDVRYEGFRLPTSAGRLAKGSGRRPRRFPTVNTRCTACGACEEICPKGAVAVRDVSIASEEGPNGQGSRRAVVDLGKCIQCYCCHEVCPERAIELRSVQKS